MFPTTHTFSRVLCVTLTLFVSSLAPFAFFATVHAQGLAVRVQPTTIDERVDPGQVVEGELTVTNESGGTQTYYIGARNISGMELSGRPLFKDEADSKDPLLAASWITPLVESVTLGEGEQASVPYRIMVPADASPGGYFAAFFVTREADSVSESGAGVGFHVASLVNLRVNGDVLEDMVVKEFKTNKRLFTKPSVTFGMRIENTGTVHERPVGIITVYDMLGNEVGQLMLNEHEGAILPRTERVFESTWNDDGFQIGRYTAQASVVFGDLERRTISRSLTFWVLPVREIAFALGGLVVLVLVFVFAIRAYIRSVLRGAGHDTTRERRAKAQASFAKKLLRTTLWFVGLVVLLVVAMLVFFA